MGAAFAKEEGDSAVRPAGSDVGGSCGAKMTVLKALAAEAVDATVTVTDGCSDAASSNNFRLRMREQKNSWPETLPGAPDSR